MGSWPVLFVVIPQRGAPFLAGSSCSISTRQVKERAHTNTWAGEGRAGPGRLSLRPAGNGRALLEAEPRALCIRSSFWSLTPRNRTKVLAISGHTAGKGDPEATGTLCQEIRFVAKLGKAPFLRSQGHRVLPPRLLHQARPQQRRSALLAGGCHAGSHSAALRESRCVGALAGPGARGRRSQPGQPRTPGGTRQCPETGGVVTTRGVRWASSGWRLGMLPNTLRRGQRPSTRNHLAMRQQPWPPAEPSLTFFPMALHHQ